MDKSININLDIKSIKGWPEKDKKIIYEGLVLMHLHREIDMYAEMRTSRFGLSVRQMEILDILFHNPGRQLTPADLADEAHLTRSTMTGNLDSLERKGFLSRKIHPKDRRMMLVNLTKEGLEFCNEKMPERYNEILEIIGSLSLNDRKHIKRIYIKLLTLLKEISVEETN